jgi:hypothetical protein
LAPACEPLALRINATIDAYVSAERLSGFSGGIDVRMRVNNSCVEWVPQEFMKVLPASAGASPPPLSVRP